MRTPVNCWRASSVLAARTTWPRAADMVDPESTKGSLDGDPIEGKSATAIGRTANWLRCAEIETFSAVSSMSTLPAGSALTMSAVSRAGITVDPAASIPTGTETLIVSSRSVPVMVNTSSATSRRTPDSTGDVPVEFVAPRPAVASAVAKISRSHRNFTGRSFSPYRAYKDC